MAPSPPPPPPPPRQFERRVRLVRVMALKPPGQRDAVGGEMNCYREWYDGEYGTAGARNQRVLPGYYGSVSNGDVLPKPLDPSSMPHVPAPHPLTAVATVAAIARHPATPAALRYERREASGEFQGIKRAFRSDDDGSVISPHSWGHLVAIFCAECIGTFILLFLGCLGAELTPDSYTKENAHIVSALAFGITVMIVIQIIGHTSDAHINPAVTLCALILGRLRVVAFFIYFLGQLSGALLGVGVLKLMTPEKAWNVTSTYGCCEPCLTIPHWSLSGFEAFLGEFLITFILILVVCGVWDKRNTNDSAAPIKFGLTIAGIALAMGPFTGASMNPVRSLAPAVWEANFEKQWVYWVAPLSASAAATLLYMFVFMKDHGKITNIYGRRHADFHADAPLTHIKGSGTREAGEPDE